MAYSLSQYKQEVIINFNAEEDTAALYMANPSWIQKLDRLVEPNPKQFEMYRQEKMDGRAELAQRMREQHKINSAARNEEQEPQNGH